MKGTDKIRLDIEHSICEKIQTEMETRGFALSQSSSRFLREVEVGIVDDVTISSSVWDGGNAFTVSLYFGVQIKEVVSLILNALSLPADTYRRTIFQLSTNALKQKIIQYQGPINWTFSGNSISQTFCLEMIDFVDDFILKYFERFHDLDTIRNSLVGNDGLALNLYPFQEVFAIDVMRHDWHNLANYVKEKYKTLDDYEKEDWTEFYEQLEAALKFDIPRWPELLNN